MTIETVRLRHPTENLVLGRDGYQPSATADQTDSCCPAPLCADVCATACAYVNLLPTGPMWDFQKQQAVTTITGCQNVAAAVSDCPSMAQYAIYSARVLHDHIDNILWPAVRESDPNLAVDTLDDWLERLNWVDCYRSFCRSDFFARTSPYERVVAGCTETGYHATDFADDFENALKHAIVRALVRASVLDVPNLDGINWVIAPLGAVLEPTTPYPDEIQNAVDNTCGSADVDPPCFCGDVDLTIRNEGDTLPVAPTAACDDIEGTVPALQTYDAAGTPTQLYPGVIAAECIARSLMPALCPNIVNRQAVP